MKRHSSSDSLIQICPSGSPEEKGMYGRGAFPTIMDAMEDEEECGEEELCSGGGSHHSGGGGGGEKKRRLSTEQVRALEKNFEVENKLDPERKLRLAQDLGLQPRQVAVWFQNRRARWKTKQLERDYTALKSTYDVLRLDFDALHRDNQSLSLEIKELKAKLTGETSTTTTVKEEELVASESEIKPEDEEPPTLIYKDGFSDSDSSAVLNEDSSTTSMVNNNNSDKSAAFAWPPSFMSSESRVHKGGFGLGLGFSFQHQLMKAEGHGFLAGEEPCSSFFAEETAPTLPWCYEQWNWMDTGGENNNVGRKEGPF